jgi:hypothetical protein
VCKYDQKQALLSIPPVLNTGGIDSRTSIYLFAHDPVPAKISKVNEERSSPPIQSRPVATESK